MAIYFKPVVNNDWYNLGNWFTNAAGTTPALYIPWVQDNPYKNENLEFATGITVSPNVGGNFGDGFSITGTCNMNLRLGYSGFEDYNNVSIFSGTWSGTLIGDTEFAAAIYGGTFQSTVSVISISGGTFQVAVSNSNISGGVFQSTVSGSSISGGTFNSTVSNSNISAGTFQNVVSGGNISGGTFNGSFTQNGNVSGGTFNGSYTYVSGNVTGGTFNNGLINQFYRNSFPSNFIFGGYNPKALDVLGTGLV